MPGWTAVASVDDFKDRAILPVRILGYNLIVLWIGDTLHACQRLCPHEFSDLACGRIAQGRLLCSRHYVWFDLSDGRSGNGWNLPPLKVYPVRSMNGTIEIDAAAVAADPPVPLPHNVC